MRKPCAGNAGVDGVSFVIPPSRCLGVVLALVTGRRLLHGSAGQRSERPAMLVGGTASIPLQAMA